MNIYYIAILTFTSLLSFTSSLPPTATKQTLNDGIDTWCGKAYRSSDPAIDPGGRIDPPTLSKAPLLDLKIQPRISPYLESDSAGSFIVDTSISYIHGVPFPLKDGKLLIAQANLSSNDTSAVKLRIQIERVDSKAVLFSGDVPVNFSGNVVQFSLAQFRPATTPYSIKMTANGKFTAYTQLRRLPNPVGSQAVTKIDNLYGALLVQENGTWRPFFPYSFYLSSQAADPSQLASFAKKGYNVLHVIPPYDLQWFEQVAKQAEKLGLWIMYDMRHDWQSESLVKEQVRRFAKNKNFLLWYTADEPDGHGSPREATRHSYDWITSVDPYHPVSLCLNCANYYFEPYSSGADILLTDAYPVGVDTTFSRQFHTPCNSTYGCCGCDDCYGTNDLTNVPARLDQLQGFQKQLGQNPKPFWVVPQAFGNQDHWNAIPSPGEEAVMTTLGVNHGAKGVVMWTWPTASDLADITSRLSKVLAVDCARWILGTRHYRVLTVTGAAGIDVSAWLGEKEILLSIVNPGRQPVETLSVGLPPGVTATGIGHVFWGQAWSSISGSTLRRTQMAALGIDIFTIKVTGSSGLVASTALVDTG